MRFPKLSTSLIAILAVALAAPVIGGCAVPTGEEQLGTQRQAVEGGGGITIPVGPGDVVNGARAAVEIVGMFKTYQEYGVATITTTDLMRKLDAVDADIQELNKSVAEVQATVMDFFTSEREQDALSKLDVIHVLMDGYRTAQASNDPQALPTFLGKVSNGTTIQATLKFSDLMTLNDIEIGTNKRGLLSLLAEREALRGEAGAKDDRLGHYASAVRSAQEEGFFLLLEASKNDGSVDPGLMKREHAARMADFDRAFIAATNEYNKLLAGQAVKSRSASVGACTYYGSNIFGIKLNPDSGDYYFQDDTWTGPRVDLTDWMDKSNPIWTYVGPGRVACDNARNDFIAARSSETKSALSDRLAAVEKVFKSWATISGGENLVGQYQNPSDGGTSNPWLTVTVVKTGKQTLRWTNGAQVSWTLTLTDDITKLAVGSDSPYYANGYTTAKVVFADDGYVSGIVGPDGELYKFDPATGSH